MACVRIGISGWRYAPWRGDFYPEGLAQKRELAFAARAVGSFYALQTPERYADWAAQTPEDFVFSVKAPRFITHVRRLRDIEAPLANFMASGLLRLGPRLGALLWQFPPSFRFDAERFEAFLAQLPHDGEQALALARQCEPRMHREGYLDLAPGTRLRHAVEIRHESFRCTAFIELLRRHGVALVVADTAGKWPLLEDLTADFVYLRLHGDKALYASGYSEEALKAWQRRIEAWQRGRQVPDARLAEPDQLAEGGSRDVYCYFDNDLKVRAPYDARRLLERLGLDRDLAVRPGQPPAEGVLP